MAETLSIPTGTKEEVYSGLLPQIESLVSGTDDLIANLANIAAVLKQAFDFHWVGFYRTTQPQLLTLGPFQGPLACVSIPFDKGVCGAAARNQETVIVEDVETFPGHIACSSLSRSEIVVPLVSKGETWLVLDVDSVDLNGFDRVDQVFLEKVVGVIAKQHFR
jgi:GAF domain-containing protein